MHTIKQRKGPDLGLPADQSGSPRNREWETEKQHELKQPTPLDWSGIGRSWRKTRCMQRAACVSLLRRRHLLLLLLLLWVDLQWLLWQPRPTFSSNPLELHSSGTLPSQNVRGVHRETIFLFQFVGGNMFGWENLNGNSRCWCSIHQFVCTHETLVNAVNSWPLIVAACQRSNSTCRWHDLLETSQTCTAAEESGVSHNQ